MVTSGRPEASAGATVGSQWAWTRSAFRAARRTVRAIEARSGGTAHGFRTAFFVSPAPYASPKSLYVPGATTSTSTPRSRSRSARSATKRPA